MNLLEWLAGILEEIFPPWVILGPDEEGVRIRSIPLPWNVKTWLEARSPLFGIIAWAPPNCQIIRSLKPGFIFSVPFIDEVRSANVKFGKVDLDNISVETADRDLYYVSLVLRYRVFNTRKALIEVDDYESSLYAAVAAVVVAWANEVTGRVRASELIAACEPKVKELGSDWGCMCRGIEVNSIHRPWEIKEITLSHQLVDNK